MPYVTIRYGRDKLYEELRAEAVTTVAKRYSASEVTGTIRFSRFAGPS